MRRLLGVFGVMAVAATLAVLGTGASDGGNGYQVRAIFQNAFSLVPGEDVKVAGVKVGKIDSLDVTPQQQAAVVLDITLAGFDDFRKDAECTIRPQSLIGEKFVECKLTQPRPAGTDPPPPLPVIADGNKGAGQHYLPVEQTSRPVDVDLLNNIMRLPFRQRLGIIINEFGTALAGRGDDLRSVIRNADPALKATDKVLNLLANQNRVLSDLAKQSDISLAPLAREKKHLQGFVDQAANLATATAEKQTAFKAQFERLPAFLRELRPTMTRLGQFADQATPVLADLHVAAPDVNRLIEAQGPFTSSSTVALKSLGKATIPGRKALVAAKGIVNDLGKFAKHAKPVAKGLSDLATSFKQTGGVERLLDYLFYQVAAINGYDSFGHYLRASLIVNLCSTYATEGSKTTACASNFVDRSGARSAGNQTKTAEQMLHLPGMSLLNRRTAAVLRGMTPAEAIRQTADDPEAAALDGNSATTATAAAASGGAEAAQQPSPAPPLPQLSGTSSPEAKTSDRLLNYLLGGGE